MDVYLNLNINYDADGVSKSFQVDVNLDKIDNFNDFATKILRKADTKTSLRKNHLEINYENDWIKLIDLKSFYFFVSHSIHLGQEIRLRIAERSSKNHELFDLDGAKYRNEILDESNRPTDKIYDSRNLPEAYCAICSHSSKDEEKITQLGCFYGPFKDSKFRKEYFIHELCALWTPNIFLDAEGKLKSVLKEVRRSQKIRCCYCHTKGAGLGCSQNGCQKCYHYLCALATDCFMDNQKYVIYCNSHLDENERNRDEINEDDLETRAEEYGDCVVCLSGLDEDKLLICEKCQKTIHTYCSIPVITEIPEGDYFCNKCLSSADENIKNEDDNNNEMADAEGRQA